ncbi:hypothetical protein NCC49_004960 [Naganishia albida]|nr:hypothetical protein NCC49_004960 [Naganishia albida]
MQPRQRARSFGRRNSTTTARPSTSLTRTTSGLYRTRTPLEHVDSIVVYEEDHHPHDSPAASTEDLRIDGKQQVPSRAGGFPLASPLHEEEEHATEPRLNPDPEVSSDRTVIVDADADRVRQRHGWKGERNDAEERERIPRRPEKAGTSAVVDEKNVEQGGVPDPRTRKWKDDIVTFDSIDDPANPKNWSYTRKVLITMLFGTTTMCSTFASSVFSSASPYISEQFGVGRQVTVLGISLFIAGYIFGPLLWSSLSEQYGRKGTILVPVFLFMCLTAITATAKDLQTIFISRFIGGTMASAPVTIVGGGLSDLFEQKER